MMSARGKAVLEPERAGLPRLRRHVTEPHEDRNLQPCRRDFLRETTTLLELIRGVIWCVSHVHLYFLTLT